MKSPGIRRSRGIIAWSPAPLPERKRFISSKAFPVPKGKALFQGAERKSPQPPAGKKGKSARIAVTEKP